MTARKPISEAYELFNDDVLAVVAQCGPTSQPTDLVSRAHTGHVQEVVIGLAFQVAAR